jgi:hypothetical protein
MSTDVIARAISTTMHVPALEEIKARVTEEEYVAILLLAGEIVEGTEGAGLPAMLVLYSLTAAAAMYSEGLKQSAAIMGRGPGSN